MLEGRLTVNIISSDRPGEKLPSESRYRRTLETMQVLRTLLDGKPVSFRGEFLQVEVEPPRVHTVSGRCPLFYFGGFSEPAREVAARAADIYLLWPDTLPRVEALLGDLRRRAAAHGRRLRVGYRVPVICRETEAEARAAAGLHRGATLEEHRASREVALGRRPPEVTARDGLFAVAMGVAAERPAALRRPVEIAELAPGGTGRRAPG